MGCKCPNLNHNSSLYISLYVFLLNIKLIEEQVDTGCNNNREMGIRRINVGEVGKVVG